MTTTNLADFGKRELSMAADLLKAYSDNEYPDSFYDDEVTVMMNRNSGNVFLTNSEYQVLMMNGNALELWHFTPYEGHEGFADELKDNYEYDKANGNEWHEDDVQYLIDNGIIDEPEEPQDDEE